MAPDRLTTRLDLLRDRPPVDLFDRPLDGLFLLAVRGLLADLRLTEDEVAGIVGELCMLQCFYDSSLLCFFLLGAEIILRFRERVVDKNWDALTFPHI